MGFQPTQPQPRKVKKNNCEVTVERTQRGIRKRISGDCTKEQLKALESQGYSRDKETVETEDEV